MTTIDTTLLAAVTGGTMGNRFDPIEPSDPARSSEIGKGWPPPPSYPKCLADMRNVYSPERNHL